MTPPAPPSTLSPTTASPPARPLLLEPTLQPVATPPSRISPSAAPAGWQGRLSIHYRADGAGDAARTVAHDTHHGPLRVLQALYPEGPRICHHVLVHPPGGIVGGDVLDIELHLQPGTHALLTTAGATRFYRSAGALASQQARLFIGNGARLEWLPLETIAHSGCIAENTLTLHPAPGAEAIGWEVLALGLPAASAPFAAGRYLQQLELPGRWLERGLLRADDHLLRDSPLGLAGCPVLATLWFVAGTAIAPARQERLIDAARAAIDAAAAGPIGARAGVTSPQPGVLVLRALAQSVEPAMALLQAVRGAWRGEAWALAPNPPRVWRL